MALAVAVTAVSSALVPVPEVDAWIALACGRHVAAHGVSTEDPFSFMSLRPMEDRQRGQQGAGSWLQPTGWVNQSWLCHLLLYRLYRLGGYDLLVVWKILVVAGCAFLVWLTARALGSAGGLAAGAAVIALLVSRSFLDIRPQMLSNLLTASLVLLIVMSLRRDRRYWLLMVPLVAFWCNLHGGFVVAFIMLAAVGSGQAVARLAPSRCRLLSARDLVVLAGSGFGALLASVVASPFRLTNLIHPLEISISPRAKLWRSVGEWYPAWQLHASQAGNPAPFLALVALLLLVLGAWLKLWLAPAKKTGAKGKRGNRTPGSDWPLLDPSLLAVAVAAVMLAMASRRFIPMACLAACPVAAGLGSEIVAMRRIRHAGPLLALPTRLRLGLWIAAAVGGTLIAGWWLASSWWLLVAPWPASSERDGPFMRLTAAHLRAFEAGRFLSANRLQGRVFNFWSEGAFLAWCQEPDPATGVIPLRLFIDGRAQQAYPLETYAEYAWLRAGGQLGADLAARGANPGPPEQRRIADWVTDRLRSRGIWLVIAPREEFQTAMMAALVRDARWPPVYLDDQQLILVDRASSGGGRLVEAILAGAASYPSVASRDLALAALLARSEDRAERERSLSLATGVLERTPSSAAVATLVSAGGVDAPRVRAALAAFLEQLDPRRAALRRQAGSLPVLEAAVLAARSLERLAGDAGDPQQAGWAGAAVAAWRPELDRVSARLQGVSW